MQLDFPYANASKIWHLQQQLTFAYLINVPYTFLKMIELAHANF